MLIIALLGQAEPAPYTCGICGFVVHEVSESHREAARCPRCKLIVRVRLSLLGIARILAMVTQPALAKVSDACYLVLWQ